MNRQELHEEIVRMRSEGEGISVTAIARELSISNSHAYSVLNDPSGARERARKARYGRQCEICGTPTSGSDGRKNAPKRCAEHVNRSHPRWTRELMLEAAREWEIAHGQAPKANDWQNTFVGPEHPTLDPVLREWPSWNDFLRDAGFVPRPQGFPDWTFASPGEKRGYTPPKGVIPPQLEQYALASLDEDHPVRVAERRQFARYRGEHQRRERQ
jgi:hypothetical protein